MNPYQARRLANRMHVDRTKRIESLLIRFAANGSLDIPEGTPDGHYKVKAESYVWCDFHCDLHDKKINFYDVDGDSDCNPENWRPVFVQSSDPNENF